MAVRLRSRGGRGKPSADPLVRLASATHTGHACIPLFVNLIVRHPGLTALNTARCERACWMLICMADQWWFRAVLRMSSIIGRAR